MIDPHALRRPDASRPATVSPAHPRLQAVIILASIVLLTFALYLYVLPNSQMSEAEARIAQLKAERDALSRQNAEIIRLAADFTALTRIEKRAKELGMEPPRWIFYGNVPVDPVAAGLAPSATQARAAAGPVQSPTNRWQDAIRSASTWLTARWRQTFD